MTRLADLLADVDRAGQAHFLTPVCLVPNGRAHLGHVAGPLLRMDVLRRILRWSGAGTTMVGMSDVHESYVTLQAYREESTPDEVAGRYHRAIQADLAAVGIVYDDFLDVLGDPEWRGRYERLQHGLVDEIESAGHAVHVTERMPRVVEAPADGRAEAAMAPLAGDFLTGAWLSGGCPDCGADLGGFSCESCGSLTWPERMTDARAADERMAVEHADVVTLHLDIPGGPDAVVDAARTAGLRPDFIAPVQRFLDANGARVRLTSPGRWGLPRSAPGLDEGQVLWQGSSLQIGCHYLAGERAAELTGDSNPLVAGSTVVSHMSFGIDNTVPYMVGGFGTTLAQRTYKPVDNVLTNYFYRLNGEKFSTSRRHVIWAGDAVEVGGADPDLLRAYLCHRNPGLAPANFEVAEFIDFHNDLAADIDDAVRSATAALVPGVGVDVVSAEQIGAAMLKVDLSLTTAAHSLGAAYEVVREWLGRAGTMTQTPEGALGLLVGLAHVSAPVMPALAADLWRGLTGEDEPTLDGLRRFLDSGTAPETTFAGWHRPSVISPESFAPCVSLGAHTTTAGDEQ
jgi:methionyl-tRNA synthetase